MLLWNTIKKITSNKDKLFTSDYKKILILLLRIITKTFYNILP